MAVTVSIYDQAKEDILNSVLDLDGDTLKVILGNSSMTFSAANTVYANVSANELSTANGYTAGGLTLAGAVVSHSGGTTTFDANDSVWTASGGSIGPANNAILRDTTTDRLIAHIAFGGANTAGDGTQFKIVWNASGIFTLS